MPLTADSVLQENAGAAVLTSGGTVTVTLPSGTTAGTTVLVFITQAGVLPNTPSGWAGDKTDGLDDFAVYRRSNVPASETSWAFVFSSGVNVPVPWYVVEVDGLDLDVPLDVWYERRTDFSDVRQTAGPGAVSWSTGTTGSALGTDLLVFSMWASSTSSSANAIGTWSGFSNDLTAGPSASADGGSGPVSIVPTWRLSGGANSGPFVDTATYTTTHVDSVMSGVFAYRSADSPIGYPLHWMIGFENGSHNGLSNASGIGSPLLTFNGTSGGGVVGTVGTDVIVATTSARSPSVYGCRIVQAGAAKSIVAGSGLYSPAGSSAKTLVYGYSLRVVSSTGLVILSGAESSLPSGIPQAQVVYDTATSKIGVRSGTTGSPGTPTYQSGTTATGTWVWVDVRAAYVVDESGIGVLRVSWALDGVEQTAPADASVSAAGFSAIRWGSATTQTVTQDVDDIVVTRQYAAYPLGRHSIRALTVDPTGTPTVNGTVGNFALVTSNATGAALTTGTLTSARNNIDELPPTISASSDGVVQTATAATDYLQFPMADLTLSGTEIVAAVKAIACLISTTGAGAGTLSVKGWDGTTEHATIIPTAATTPGSSTTVGVAVPPYGTGMWANTWTPSKLAAAALRMGYSTDATPDMGVHAMYLEVATRPAITGRQLSVEDDTFTVDVILSPYSSASVSYEVASADATRGATFSYSVLGVPQTPVYVAASSSTTVTVNADAFGDVNVDSFEPDPA